MTGLEHLAKSLNWPAVVHLVHLCHQRQQMLAILKEASASLSHSERISKDMEFLESFLGYIDEVSQYPGAIQECVDYAPGWRVEYRDEVVVPVSCLSAKGIANREDEAILNAFCMSMCDRFHRLHLHRQILVNIAVQPSMRQSIQTSATLEYTSAVPHDELAVRSFRTATKVMKLSYLLLFLILLNIVLLLAIGGTSFIGRDNPMIRNSLR